MIIVYVIRARLHSVLRLVLFQPSIFCNWFFLVIFDFSTSQNLNKFYEESKTCWPHLRNGQINIWYSWLVVNNTLRWVFPWKNLYGHDVTDLSVSALWYLPNWRKKGNIGVKNTMAYWTNPKWYCKARSFPHLRSKNSRRKLLTCKRYSSIISLASKIKIQSRPALQAYNFSRQQWALIIKQSSYCDRLLRLIFRWWSLRN